MAVNISTLKPTQEPRIQNADDLAQKTPRPAGAPIQGDDSISLNIEVSSGTLRPAGPERL